MRILHFLVIQILILLLFACKRPYQEFFKQPLPPVKVAVSIKSRLYVSEGRYENLEKILAVALRDHLATFATVVPEGTIAPPEAVLLHVDVYDYSTSPIRASIRRGYVTPSFSGALMLNNSKNEIVYLGSIPTLGIIRELKPMDDIIRRTTRRMVHRRKIDMELMELYADLVNREISRAFAKTITTQLQN
ncbi:MAG: hypothetical protein LBH03_06060, partial [Holophagales bacterium]|nr:hypothetical protein [Holophagales bacterium]